MKPMNPAQVVRLFHKNVITGKREWRTIYPYTVRWGLLGESCSKPGAESVPAGWLLDAADLDKPGFPTRTFVLSSVECWHPSPQESLDSE